MNKITLMFLTLWFSLVSASAFAAENTIRIEGKISDGLTPGFSMFLVASNQVCGSLGWTEEGIKWIPKTTTFDAISTVSNGKYLLTASWDAGFCAYKTGSSSLTVHSARSLNEAEISPSIESANSDRGTELHQVKTLLCGIEKASPNLLDCYGVKQDGTINGINDYFIDLDSLDKDFTIDITGR